jgi:acetyl-CoA/propionyl-CoA carboxylase biotin carboxyl carrier protein
VDFPFDKVLVANRGEIAIRVVRAAHDLGLGAVAVYSEFDRDALHVQLADEAYLIGESPAAKSYLNIDAILGAAEQSGAGAVHPGYGFLAENTAFAERVTEAGLVWIGPPAAAIAAMGGKIESRRVAADAGVQAVPGTLEPIEDVSEIVDFGEEHGWPVAIKASAGGGGKGMKVVTSADEAQAQFDSARREATAYFGDDACYLERYLPAPRHVEAQIILDTHGNGVFLGERDCSCQRRHQKLIEESPSPGFPAAARATMKEAALAVAHRVGYVNAGTVEFLFDPSSDAVYFLEMNTRLQVEHCVTEEVTGFDLAAEQIRVAAGHPLSFTQDDVVSRGWSIEVRVNAEDPAKKFLPSPGRITRWRPPTGPGVRLDSGFLEGFEVSQFYDNLLAKLVVWGRDRDEARRRMLRALDEYEVEGVATTIPAAMEILRHPDFIAGRHSTNWVETLDFSHLGRESTPAAADGAELVARDVTVEVNSKRFSVRLFAPPAPAGIRSAAGKAGGAAPRPRRAAATVHDDGTGEVVVTPMQGTIVKVTAKPGDQLKAGDPVCILEAMKMENQIVSQKGGTVVDVKVAAGDSVAAGTVVAILE